MDTKIMRLSGSTWAGNRSYPTLRRVLNASKNCALIRLYMCVKQVIRRTLNVLSGFYTEPNIVTLGPFRHAERT